MSKTKHKLVIKFILLTILVSIPIALIFIARSGYLFNEHSLISYLLMGFAISLGIALIIIDPFPFRSKYDKVRNTRSSKLE